MSIEEIYSVFLKCPNICTDSRKAQKDAIFFSLIGEHFNGNTYAESALNRGCLYAIIDEAKYSKDNRYIIVENALKTLQDLAKYHRSKLKIPIIGITGTNGKTTTKELINAVLSKKVKTLATSGNLNNHIGVPKTILSITNNTEIAIIEMGANHIGEIAELCEIAQPDYGIITNIGKAHLEGFGNFEGIVKAKSELYNWIKKSGKGLFVNIENDLLSSLSEKIKRITYGNYLKADYSGRIIKADPMLELEWFNKNNNFIALLKTHLVGKYNFENILAAIAVGSFFNVENDLINKAIEEYIPTNNRSQIITTKNNTLIVDAYNANPSSMELAINNFAATSYTNKTVILGDMFELGQDSEKEHLKILNLILRMNFSKIILVGSMFSKINNDKNIPTFINSDELASWLGKNKIPGATILIKGSRGVKMEKIIDYL
jgi:UDP-N-acetylmuramoyl-tripeptide--D-alanyl-D-alanine ligase